MTASDPESLNRFRLLATFVAGRCVDIADAPTGQAAHTNGQAIYISAGRPIAEQRREILVQSALLGAGSLDQRLVKALRTRPLLARRYLALEGHRVLAELATRLPLAATLHPGPGPRTSTADESLHRARSRAHVADPPEWFGVIKPSRLRTAARGSRAHAPDNDLCLKFDLADTPDDDGDEKRSEQSKILRLLDNPVFNSPALSDYLRKLLGGSRSPGDGTAGGEMRGRALRREHTVGPNARPLRRRMQFTDDGQPRAALGIDDALYPEWDVFNGRYRPDWCRVAHFPMPTVADTADVTDVSAAGVVRDDVLRRRLSRVGLGPKVLRGRPDGDELDIEALIDLVVDLRSGYSPPEHVYSERRKLARDLGVLILLDASGSATDADAEGLAVHDHQRRAAATLAVTLEELGDRVAVYAFRSRGRHAVQLSAVTTFGQRFGAVARARLGELHPSGYTRLGAGIRGAGAILKSQAGTPHRLLVVVSDGFPYDEGYEGRYAEADASKALDELRTEGVGCLGLSVGAGTTADAFDRVFGSASRASAPTLTDLSPRMDELFLSALEKCAAPQPP